MSKLDDIDYLTKLIYEYLYQKIQSRPIESKPLDTNYLEDLTIVKKMYEGKQLSELVNIIFNTNISYNGFNESAYKFKRLESPSTDILIRQYEKNEEMNPNNSLNVDKIINYLLSDLVIHKKTKNILLTICNADIPVKELELFIKKYPEIKLKDTASVTICEHFYKLVTLKDHLEKERNIENYKDSIFQILHCINVIQSIYPSFRHNNLNIDTILVYKYNEKSVTYAFDQKNYIFNSIGEIKITNFLKSTIKDVIENSSIESELQNPNKYYDIDTFLQSMLSLELPKEITEFIKRNYEKGLSAREILTGDSLFITKNETLDNVQTGGKRKNKKSRKSSSRKSSTKKLKTKYSMTSKEVEEILNIETPEEDTLKFLNKKPKNTEPKPENQDTNNSTSNSIASFLGENNIQSMQTFNASNNKPTPPPIKIPNTNLELKQAKSTEPIIQVEIPPTPIEPNTIGGLLGNPDQPSSGIMNTFGANPSHVNWKIAPRLQTGDVPPTDNLEEKMTSKQPVITSAHVHTSAQISIPTSAINSDSKTVNNLTNNTSKELTFDSLQHILNMPSTGENLLSFQKRATQRGGSGRVIPIYKSMKNSPYESNETKQIRKERYFEQNPQEKQTLKDERVTLVKEEYPTHSSNEPKTAFKIDILPELLPQKQRPLPPAPPENVVKMINYMIPNTYGIQPTTSILGQFSQPTGQVLSQNTYNISLANPSRVNEFREDILPSKDETMLKYTMATISERIIIYQYIRSILIRQSDGENINFMSNKSPEVRNLLSYLRILDLQTGKRDSVKNNLLGIVPKRLVIYRSCYPIRVDRANYNVGCAKNNIGINIRVYQMTIGETIVNKYKNLNYKSFETWRDISLYEQLRDNIVKQRLSPNFAMLHAYYITKDTEIDFLKLNKIRNKDIVHKQEKEQKYVLNQIYQKEMQEYLVNLQKYSTSELTKLVQDLDIHQPSDKCVIALTESGTQHIMQWASREYEDNGLAKKMINTGYHGYDVWMSVLFQLYQAMLCMYKFGISYHNFDLETNVKIKSLNFDDANKGYWKYVINGVEFFIPNYGYSVLIDSGFSDLYDDDEKTLYEKLGESSPEKLLPPLFERIVILKMEDLNNKLDDISYKVYSNDLLIDPTEEKEYDNKLNTLGNMKNAFNDELFTNEHSLVGGIKPDDKILQLLQNVKKDMTDLEKTMIPFASDKFKKKKMSGVMRGGGIKKVRKNKNIGVSRLRSEILRGGAEQSTNNLLQAVQARLAARVQAPVVQAPAQAPAVQASVVQAPVVQAPAQAPVVQAPVVQAPAVQAPVQALAVQASAVQSPVVQAPAQAPAVQDENEELKQMKRLDKYMDKVIEIRTNINKVIDMIDTKSKDEIRKIVQTIIESAEEINNSQSGGAGMVTSTNLNATSLVDIAKKMLQFIDSSTGTIDKVKFLQLVQNAKDEAEKTVAKILAIKGTISFTLNKNYTKNIDNINKRLIERLLKEFKYFLHNRVSTSLKENELTNLIESEDIKQGELVACINNNRWGIVINIEEISDTETVYKVFTLDELSGIDNKVLERSNIIKLVLSDLRKPTVVIEQTTKPNQKFIESELLETYELNI